MDQIERIQVMEALLDQATAAVQGLGEALDAYEAAQVALRSLGQFDGLDNFNWLDLLKKKLDVKDDGSQRPVISFSKNDGLQIPGTLLGRLFTAISRHQVIRFSYTTFDSTPKVHTVCPYQLKQSNDRWFLLCTPVGNDKHPFDPEFIATFALDRMDPDLEYPDGIPYIDTLVDLKARFDEIIGVTYYQDVEPEEIIFAVQGKPVDYLRTKYLHITQMELDKGWADEYRRRYPFLKGWSFFSIECRPNPELFSRLSSYGKDLVVVSPASILLRMREITGQSAEHYKLLSHWR